MMYESKLIKVYLSNWQRYIPSLTINLLALVILSLGALTNSKQVTAQVAANESDSKQEVTRNNVPATLEPKILAEINRVRTNPQDYAQWLERQRQYYDGIWLRLPGERAVRTNKGKKALEEAIAFLKEQPPLPALKTSPQAANIASSELENFATAKNIQYFSYGRKTVQGIVMGLVVDDLFPDRRRRNNLLNPDVENTGVVCKSDPRYAKVCAIAYSDIADTVDIAEVKPETNKPDKDAVVDVPEIFTTSESLKTPETPETNKPEAANATPEKTENENINQTDNTDIATLPVPPQPQVPPAPSTSKEEQPNPSAEAEAKDIEDIEVAQTEANESETEVTIEDPIAATADTEIEPEIEPEVESNTEEVVEEDSESIPESTEAEIAEIVEDDSEEVAINRDRLLEKVERGTLETGDRVIEEDGSLYDFYPLEGKAGDSFNIYLESDQFDTFVALVDSNGNTIKENDDISEEDSNSRIRVKLPEDGTYNIIVNTYDQQGTGQYVLTVSR